MKTCTITYNVLGYWVKDERGCVLGQFQTRREAEQWINSTGYTLTQ